MRTDCASSNGEKIDRIGILAAQIRYRFQNEPERESDMDIVEATAIWKFSDVIVRAQSEERGEGGCQKIS